MQNQSDTLLQKVLSESDKYQWQCQFSYLDGSRWHKVFIGDSIQYFYPASTVKLPLALLALEKLNELNIPLQAHYKTQGENDWQTFEQDLEDIFVLSGNESYNRLFDFLGGRDKINKRIHELYINAIIQHKLAINRAYTSKVRNTKVKVNQEIIKIKYPKSNPISALKNIGVHKGIGYIEKGKIKSVPMDFTNKNYLPIPTLQEILQRLVYPDYFSKEKRFNITEEQRSKVLHWMQVFPKEIGKDSIKYPDNYVKFFLFGETPIIERNDWQIFNKIGMAYGTLTDNAWIYNKVTKENFFLTSTILVNQNQIFNDNQYEYETIGIPFLHRLSWAIIDWMQLPQKN